MDLDFDKISTIVGIPKSVLIGQYNKWFDKKQEKGMNAEVVDLKLIAALSGLSVPSISNFVNNKKGSISIKKTAILEELTSVIGYVPFNAAKKLRSSNKMSIGFVFSVTTGTSMEYYVEVLRGVKSEANKYGYFVDIYDIEEEKRKDFFSELPFMGLVDGLIIVSSVVNLEQLKPLIGRKIPVVLIHPKIEATKPPVVSGIFSDPTAFSQLLKHLFVDHKYKNPILVSVNLNDSIQRKEKYNLYVKAVKDNGIDFDKDKNVVFISSHSFHEGTRAYGIAKDNNPEADVFVCLTDTLAVPIIRLLEKDNKKAAVTGYANFEIAEVFDLTTIEQNIQNLGIEAFQQLYFSMKYLNKNDEFPEYIKKQVPGSFIKRNSCGCLNQ